MSSREYPKPPAPFDPALERAIRESAMISRADTVAAVAHGAIGQRRADRITPYIDHPRRAAALILHWNGAGIIELGSIELERCVAAALLHDVLEDTKLSRAELSRQFPGERKMLALVDRMTEPPGDPDAPEYYGNIARDTEAVIVKCADRCANLDDVLKDVRRGDSIGRWRRYIQKTRRDVAPMLHMPGLQEELHRRLEEIERALRTAAP